MVAATSLSLLRNLVDALPKCEGCGAVAMLGRADHSALYCEACGAAKAGFDFCKWAGAAHRAQVAITAPTIPISDEELHVMRHAIGADRIDAKAKRCRKPQNRRATLEAQKQIKALEAKRNTKRRQLFDAQDDVDKKRAELIEEIERQLQTKTSIEPVFTLRWTLGDGAGTTA